MQKKPDRVIRYSATFRTDLKRQHKGQDAKRFLAELKAIELCLTKREPIPRKYGDHPLKGSKNGMRDCHVLPDLVLLYRIVEDDVVEMHRLGSHSDLF